MFNRYIAAYERMRTLENHKRQAETHLAQARRAFLANPLPWMVRHLMTMENSHRRTMHNYYRTMHHNYMPALRNVIRNTKVPFRLDTGLQFLSPMNRNHIHRTVMRHKNLLDKQTATARQLHWVLPKELSQRISNTAQGRRR